MFKLVKTKEQYQYLLQDERYAGAFQPTIQAYGAPVTLSANKITRELFKAVTAEKDAELQNQVLAWYFGTGKKDLDVEDRHAEQATLMVQWLDAVLRTANGFKMVQSIVDRRAPKLAIVMKHHKLHSHYVHIEDPAVIERVLLMWDKLNSAIDEFTAKDYATSKASPVKVLRGFGEPHLSMINLLAKLKYTSLNAKQRQAYGLR